MRGDREREKKSGREGVHGGGKGEKEREREWVE
jgi:hypothetical protein